MKQGGKSRGLISQTQMMTVKGDGNEEREEESNLS